MLVAAPPHLLYRSVRRVPQLSKPVFDDIAVVSAAPYHSEPLLKVSDRLAHVERQAVFAGGKVRVRVSKGDVAPNILRPFFREPVKHGRHLGSLSELR